ncbi:hypothetical protein BGX38DRAFT_1270300 [Terfezia claveryi]|nr:hypothetical protein BGX38DRAFT_1270300 [Terfezia claveryi]
MTTTYPSDSLTIPFSLPEDVKQWTEDHVATFLMENNGVYKLKVQHIEVIKKQEVNGLGLLDLTAEDSERWGIPGWPAKIIVQLVNKLKVTKGQANPAAGSERHVEEDPEPLIKCFKPNSRVHAGIRPYVYYADQTGNNSPLIKMIEKGFYVRMYGPRASGKSSRTVEAMTVLRSKGFECIYIDLQGVRLSNEERFWSDLNARFSRFRLPNEFNSSSTFLKAFAESDRWTRPVVIFIDEFDVLLNPDAKGALSSLLSTLRSAKDNGDYIIRSIVSIGTFAITLLDQVAVNLSPFNSTENFSGTSLTKAQVQGLFQEFANDRGISIDSKVIDDIYQLTNGHAGMAHIYGAAINNSLLPLEDHSLNFTCWQKFAPLMLRQILAYPTFQRMVKTLIEQKEVVDCLRLRFLGNFEEFIAVPPNEKFQADFLAALGVLSPDANGSKFKMSSPIIDSLVRQHVIPVVFSSCPNTRIPRKKRGGPLDFLSILREVLKVFNKELIERAAGSSYKKAKVEVNGCKEMKVPRESVYDIELMRILSNWLCQERYTVTSQWHLVVDGSHKYSDIIINDDESKIVLELLATSGPGLIQEHIDRTKDYKINSGAGEAWVVHFTLEDNYLQHPLWQSNEVLSEGVNVVHVLHDYAFQSVRIGASYINSNGTVELIEDERVI